MTRPPHSTGATEHRNGAWARWQTVGVALLVGIAAAALLLRVPSIAAPLGIDQGLWASAVHGMARGQVLYQDVWEQRPPGIYFVYLAGFRLFGWHAATVAWLDILAAVAGTILLGAIAFRLSGRVAAALTAALYAALTMPAWLFGYGGLLERSVCETFVVVCIAVTAWCGVVLRQRVSIPLAVIAGLAAGFAVVLKPNTGLYAPALLGWLLVERRRLGHGDVGANARLTGGAVAGAVIAPLLTLWWLWHLGVLDEARVAIVDFNRAYLAQGFALDAFAEGFAKAVWWRIKTDPLWLAGGVGVLLVGWELIRRRTLDPLASLAVWWGGAAALTIAVNGSRLYSTYFIQAHAPLALLAAWTILQAARPSIGRRLVAALTLALMLTLLVQRGYVPKVIESARADLGALRGADQSSYLERFGGYANRRGYSARANAELADYLRSRTRSDDRVFAFSTNGSGVYFLADRLSAHRFLRVNFFINGPIVDPPFRLDAVVEDLLRTRPVYLVFEQLNSNSAWARVIDALREEADVVRLLSGFRLETTIEDFTVYRRID